MLDAFRSADQVLLSGVQGITDLITTPGLINLDFADVQVGHVGAGSALMGIGSAAAGPCRPGGRGGDLALYSGQHRRCPRCPLSVQGGSDLGLFEINESARLVRRRRTPEANIISVPSSTTLGDEVRVTVIAAGPDGGTREDGAADERPSGPRQRPTRPQRRPRPAPRPDPDALGQAGSAASPTACSLTATAPRPSLAPAAAPGASCNPASPPPAQQVVFEDGDDLDVPAWLKWS